MVGAFRKLAAPLQRRISNMVARGVLNLVNDGTAMQELQIGLLADETRDQVERAQDYGFTSHPHPGCEPVVVFLGGSRDHGICIACDDRRYRLVGLAQGEVAIYTDEGDRIHLKRGREIHVLAGARIRLEAPDIDLIGEVHHEGGDINSTGKILDVTGNSNHHSH